MCRLRVRAGRAAEGHGAGPPRARGAKPRRLQRFCSPRAEAPPQFRVSSGGRAAPPGGSVSRGCCHGDRRRREVSLGPWHSWSGARHRARVRVRARWRGRGRGRERAGEQCPLRCRFLHSSETSPIGLFGKEIESWGRASPARGARPLPRRAPLPRPEWLPRAHPSPLARALLLDAEIGCQSTGKLTPPFVSSFLSGHLRPVVPLH